MAASIRQRQRFAISWRATTGLREVLLLPDRLLLRKARVHLRRVGGLSASSITNRSLTGRTSRVCQRHIHHQLCLKATVEQDKQELLTNHSGEIKGGLVLRTD